jgi:hypothetical protein
MQRWECLFVNAYGNIVPASHRLQQVYQYLKSSLPHLGPKDLKIAGTEIHYARISLVDIMNLLGADGWEVVCLDTTTTLPSYLLKRPTS